MPKKYSSSQPARLFLKCSELKPLPLLPYAILFLVCRLADSSSSFEDDAPAGTHSDSPALRLQQQLHLWGKRREEVPSDGHCLIHAWLRVSVVCFDCLLDNISCNILFHPPLKVIDEEGGLSVIR